MLNLPSPVSDFMLKLLADTRSPAYLLVKKDGLLTDWGGDLAAYGIKDLQKEQRVGEQVFFLEGMLPIDASPTFSLTSRRIRDSRQMSTCSKAKRARRGCF